MTRRIPKTVGVVTPGGDAPGMNAAIRAVVRKAIFEGFKVKGIRRGYRGLAEGEIVDMDLRSVGGIINRGGTLLRTARCPEMKEKSYRDICVKELRKAKIDALIIIGGDGSMRSGGALGREYGLAVVHIPASIDNDIPGTDLTIGFDTAVNTAVEAIDKIRDTATSHERLFVVEVMGRNSGSIAVEVGLACGAEAIIIPEIEFDIDELCDRLKEGRERGKTSSIVVVAEGVVGGAPEMARKLGLRTQMDVKVAILGHMQRGGAPTALSRTLAARLGILAVDVLKSGQRGKTVALHKGRLMVNTISKLEGQKKGVDREEFRIATILAR